MQGLFRTYASHDIKVSQDLVDKELLAFLYVLVARRLAQDERRISQGHEGLTSDALDKLKTAFEANKANFIEWRGTNPSRTYLFSLEKMDPEMTRLKQLYILGDLYFNPDPIGQLAGGDSQAD